jgi:hypothetical protein
MRLRSDASIYSCSAQSPFLTPSSIRRRHFRDQPLLRVAQLLAIGFQQAQGSF